ncbi:MAG TPA: NAD(P)-dependent glycerol-3-phosphate dehydrogenase [Candidatus Pullichristensenella avicola]|nr:NAD(P)-dependent glycerol-3-phosphate dehydrogenase [Candidatus Pullichristensenella avicola]
MYTIGILGTGTWGTALARLLAGNGHAVTAWSALPEEVASLSETRRHPRLGDMVVPESVAFTGDIGRACAEKDMLVFAVPSPYVRATARAAAPFARERQVAVDVAKGMETDTLLTLSEVIGQEMAAAGKAPRLVALSGPTHAEEVARDLPTTIVSSSRDADAARFVQDAFMSDSLRVYTNADIRGVEVAGALKNVIALAAGIAGGLGYGDNARAAIITRGIAEMARLGAAMGCERETFSGLTGLGDLVVTCTSMHSRNNRCGMLIGGGMAPADAVREVGMVVEGLNALPAALALGKKYGVELPIIEGVDAIVRRGASPRAVVESLMRREKKPETWL